MNRPYTTVRAARFVQHGRDRSRSRPDTANRLREISRMPMAGRVRSLDQRDGAETWASTFAAVLGGVALVAIGALLLAVLS